MTHLSPLSTGGSPLWPHHADGPPALGGVAESPRAGFGHWVGGLEPGGCQGNSSSLLLAAQDDTSAFPCTGVVSKSQAGTQQRSKSTGVAQSPRQPLRQPTLISFSPFHILPPWQCWRWAEGHQSSPQSLVAGRELLSRTPMAV